MSSAYRFHRGRWWILLRNQGLTEMVPVDAELAAILSEAARESAREKRAFERRVSELVDQHAEEIRQGLRQPRQLREGRQ